MNKNSVAHVPEEEHAAFAMVRSAKARSKNTQYMLQKPFVVHEGEFIKSEDLYVKAETISKYTLCCVQCPVSKWCVGL